MIQLHFATLHYTNKEDWHVCVEHINAIRNNHDKDDEGDNGVWIYLMSDNCPIKVTEPMDEVIRILNNALAE